jgi:hypothetical protein
MPESLTVIGKESAGPAAVEGQTGVDHRAQAAGGKESLLLRILAAAGSLAPLAGWPGWGNR